MISRLIDGDVFRFAKRIPGLAAVAAVALIFTGLTQAQLKPPEVDSTAVRPSLTNRAEIPAGAQSVVSATLGRADEAYRAKSSGQGYATENPANHLSAQYAADGVKIRLQNANLDLEFQGWGYGKPGVKEGQATVAPLVDANRVEYRRGALTEWYVNGPLGIEQGFTISQAPIASADSQHDALEIALHLRGNLSASIEPGRHALTLRDQRGVETLRYGPLLVHDASGRELESWMEVQDGSLRLRVNTAGARYPIIVDPWVQGAQLTISSAVAGAQPYSVAVSGNTVVVGAPQTTINGHAAQGAAFVFVEPNTGVWADTSTYTAELYNNSGSAGDNLGWSVGISGNTVVVGAIYATVGGNASEGVAYVFVEPTGGWAAEPTPPTYAELTEATGSAGDSFGWSVGISGSTVVGSSESTVVVGDPFTNTNQGAAYVFVAPLVNNVPTWSSETETAELTAPTGVLENKIGWSVGINESGDTVVVGAPFFPTTGSNQYQGAAYVFVEPTPIGWVNTSTYTAELTASDGATDAFFGLSVGISENTVVAGAPQATIGPGPNSFQGAAYVFVAATPSDWSTTSTYNAKLTASNGLTGDFLGWSVGISGNTVVAAAPDAAAGSTATEGAAYVFVEPTPGGVPTWSSETETAELTASTGVTGEEFGFKVGISGNTIVASAPDVTVTNMNPGAAYVFTPPPPSFTLSASQPNPVVQGNSGTSTITVTSANGFTGSVTLAVTSPLPTGVTPAFSANPVTPPANGTITSTLTLTASPSATLGTTSVLITGTSGALAPTTAFSLTVTPPPGFTLSANAPSLTVAQGASGTSTITVSPATGFTGSVTLAASDLPSGVTAAFGTNPTTGTSVLTLAASMTATPGVTATVTITGTSGTLAPQTTPVSLTVTASYSASVGAATPASVSPGGSSTATVTLAAGTGYTGSVSLSCTITPVVTGATAPGCGFGNTSPVTVTGAGGSATMMFTSVGPLSAVLQGPLSEIKDSMAIASSNPRARPSGTKLQFYALWLPIPGLALIGLGLGSRGSRRKKLLGLLLLGMILASLLILPACGNSSGSHSSGTPAGAYTITITGKDANGVIQIGAAPTVVVTVN